MRSEEGTVPTTASSDSRQEPRSGTTTPHSEPTTTGPEALEQKGEVVEKDEPAPLVPSFVEGKWEEIEISFISDERVQVRRGKKSETLNYAEFGFEDARTGSPNQAWVVLRRLAERHGNIENEMEARMKWSKLEKRIQGIRSVLRNRFGIASDPIPFLERSRVQDKSGYNTL
jgi:hypothetical protein